MGDPLQFDPNKKRAQRAEKKSGTVHLHPTSDVDVFNSTYAFVDEYSGLAITFTKTHAPAEYRDCLPRDHWGVADFHGGANQVKFSFPTPAPFQDIATEYAERHERPIVLCNDDEGLHYNEEEHGLLLAASPNNMYSRIVTHVFENSGSHAVVSDSFTIDDLLNDQWQIDEGVLYDRKNDFGMKYAAYKEEEGVHDVTLYMNRLNFALIFDLLNNYSVVPIPKEHVAEIITHAICVAGEGKSHANAERSKNKLRTRT